jgi:hypothetical protein
MKSTLSLLLTLSLLISTPAFAHSGGTDSNGCHTNTSTGDYHCHNSGSGGGGGGQLSQGAIVGLAIGGFVIAAGLTTALVLWGRQNNQSTQASIGTTGTGLTFKLTW